MDSTWKEIQLEATTPLATKHVKGFSKHELKHQQTINHNYACRILSLSHHVGGGVSMFCQQNQKLIQK